LAAAAEASGWEAIDSPAADIVVLVAADPTGGTRKLIAARRNGTPIVTYDEWTAVMFDGVFPESAV
jgi:ABC-type sugar transport system substrate-binding protein